MEFGLDWKEMIFDLSRMGVAYLLALPIGWERERRSRGAGLRTFPLVSTAACAYMLTGISVLESNDAHARVMFGIITGIGFIGGGAIIKSAGNVTGTATAASIWNTGAIGISVAMARFEIALLLSLLNYITLRYVGKLKPHEKDTQPRG